MRLPSLIERIPVRRFNLACAALALLWLLVTVPWGLRYRPTFQDFPQFYMSGVIVRDGSFHALYPTPRPDNMTNPGLGQDGYAHPRYAQLRDERKVPDFTRPITPPPSALFFLPFAWLSYPAAFYTWAIILSFCVWGITFQAGRLYRILSGGRATHWEGILALLIVLSPMTARSIRITNVTPVIGLCIGWIVLAAIRGDRFRTGLAIVLGATLKYATLVLVPILLLGRKWRTLAGAAAFGLALLAVSLAVMGTGPFRFFATTIAPTLHLGHLFPGNQSLAAMLGRLNTIPGPLPMPTVVSLKVMQFVFLAVIGLIFLRRSRHEWSDPLVVSGGAAALVSWLLIFSPISWEHYPIFLAPLAGWLLWEAGRSRRMLIFVAVVALLLNAPISIIHVDGFVIRRKWIAPEPFNSTQLMAIAAVFALGLLRVRPTPATARDDDADNAVAADPRRNVDLAPARADQPLPAGAA